jgi:hypothetical protein
MFHAESAGQNRNRNKLSKSSTKKVDTSNKILFDIDASDPTNVNKYEIKPLFFHKNLNKIDKLIFVYFCLQSKLQNEVNDPNFISKYSLVEQAAIKNYLNTKETKQTDQGKQYEINAKVFEMYEKIKSVDDFNEISVYNEELADVFNKFYQEAY